ncbi:MAG: hypothetical protein ABJZ55_12675 [Fuerstiella sp.]
MFEASVFDAPVFDAPGAVEGCDSSRLDSSQPENKVSISTGIARAIPVLKMLRRVTEGMGFLLSDVCHRLASLEDDISGDRVNKTEIRFAAVGEGPFCAAFAD